MAAKAGTISALGRRKVLLLYPYYWPLYKAGGPVQSLFNIAATFGDQCDFFVISLNREIDSMNADESIITGSWVMGPNGERIYYASSINPFLIKRLLDEIDPYALFINGIFNAQTTLPGLLWARLLNKKIIISPRGMLQEWALQRNAFLKRIFLVLFKLGLNQKVLWHATDENEVNDIERVFGRCDNIHVASNIPRRVTGYTPLDFPTNDGKVKLVFLSLINPNKNLHLVIDALNISSSRFTLDIYGPIIDHAYWRLCERKIDSLGSIQYKGPVPPWKVPDLLTAYHFFILPTQGENFGHAIFDSLAAGVPVIISKNTPWKNIAERNAGFYIDVDGVDSIKETLESISKMDQPTYNSFRGGSHVYAAEYWKSKDYSMEYRFLLND